MLVTFKDVLVLEVYSGVSKKSGNPWGRIKFLDMPNADVYEVSVFGDASAALSEIQPKSTINAISFDLRPDRSGGVRLVPAW